MPTDPYGARKATVKADLRAGRKGTCAACGQQKTVYPAQVYPEGRPWEAMVLCSDCVRRVQQEQRWPLEPASPA
jgi:hypothetical protein